MQINMPVEAICENCINCPELEIDVRTLERYEIRENEDGTGTQVNMYQNTLRCTNYDKCRIVKLFLEQTGKAETKKKEPAAKKTTAARPRQKQASK